MNDKTKEFILKANIKHNNEYLYHKVNYINNITKVTIKCRKHGYFEQIPRNHLSGARCLKCGYESMKNKQQMSRSEFIKKARKIHGDAYIYDKVKYVNNSTKITIICRLHGEFMQTPSLHITKKNGCKECGIKQRSVGRSLTKEQFIEKSKIIHGDKYDYSEVQYINNHTKIKIGCKKHGIYLTTPNQHLRSQICPQCSTENRSSNNKLKTTEEYINEAISVHGNDFDYSKIVYVNDRSDIIVICKKHDEFKINANRFLRKGNCAKCVNRHNYTNEEFIEKANLIHKNEYDYSKTKYINNYTKIIIICREHGEFIQKPSTHINDKIGCAKCGYKKLAADNSMGQEEFIKKANEKHDNKYDYTETIYVNNRTPIKIYCKKHNIFEQIPTTHLSGSGCPTCGTDTMKEKLKLSTDDFIKKANIMHNNKYDYSMVDYINNNTKVKIKCLKHGFFYQQPNAHIYGENGCPKCSKMGYSYKAIYWLNFVSYLDNIEIQHAENGSEYKIPGTNYKVDGYCAKTNTVYEFNGCIFHGCPMCHNPNDISPINKKIYKHLYQETISRKNFIKSKGYQIINIWEHTWDATKNNSIVKNYFEKIQLLKEEALQLLLSLDSYDKIIINQINVLTMSKLRILIKNLIVVYCSNKNLKNY
jgi:Zn ribbon nucleic-acid-binding protein